MIGVLDYGIGNIGSILNMLKKVGADAKPVTTVQELTACDKLILPGVGAFDQGMTLLSKAGLREALDQAVADGKPVLGICLGMQMLGLRSEEGTLPGLGYIPFSLKRFSFENSALKVPHMGWDEVYSDLSTPSLLDGMDENPRFYFVHSYYAICENPQDEWLRCDYDQPFAAAVHRGNVWGTQFHPEKSHRFGLCLMRNFAKE